MSLSIVRNDITKMNTEAVVNTANANPVVGPGCDNAIYAAAGYDELLKYRIENIGSVSEGEVFITPGFNLAAKFIIHAVSPIYIDGNSGEEEKLRLCYRKSLDVAVKNNIKSIAFPLISTGGFGYPKEEGLRIAIDEINAFLLYENIDVTLVVFDNKSTDLGVKIYAGLEQYIDQNYVDKKRDEEYNALMAFCSMPLCASREVEYASKPPEVSRKRGLFDRISKSKSKSVESFDMCESATDELEEKLAERFAHMSDTYSEYLLYLIQSKGMENADVYKRAIVDKKTFSKIKNNPDYHPQKITALCLCVGARLNLDETKDLLARAGYALSPCDKIDIIFSYFIENEIYDMIELDIQLEEHGLPCIIS